MSSSPEQSVLATSLRTDTCGLLRAQDVGRTVRLGGWVHRSRDLGGLVFIDLRDRTGLVQLAFGPAWSDAETLRIAAAVGVESVVLCEGEVVAREPERQNPDMLTGTIEVRVTSLRVVGPAVTPALPVARGRGEKMAAEELRLRHRYLDLRRPELQENLVLRHRLLQVSRRFLSDRGYLELETPILTKPTPEGARDYLVPSRVHPGEFYALPQSPQIYKQLFMCCGFDRYFQIARCFRDEDLRADRQPEFTQIDIEASFIEREDILALAEGLIGALWTEAGHSIPAHFDRMSYRDAMEFYGCDRPDLRYDLRLADYTAVFAGLDFAVTTSAIANGARVRGLIVPGGAAWSRKQVDELEALAKSAGAGGLLRLRHADGAYDGPLAKFLTDDARAAFALADGDLALFVAAPDRVSSPALDRVRQECARRLELVDDKLQRFIVVMDFPMFEEDPTTGSLAAVHHPFTAPHAEDMQTFPDQPARWRALAYDVVLNGTELGGGSIRISDPAMQSRMFSLLGIGDVADQERRFGFLLEGLRAGAPPHGGIAFGFDRIAMLLSGAPSLRDVIAFPKTTAARSLFEGAPVAVPPEDLAELHLTVTGSDA
ncbi:aspartate--tRNA ligase [Gemmatimonas groenlandica]|uniref:Aspartate--tRNA ligase n=1 Tax=Gemmatimonas groenlandica TaxID=2732249 RepID=A0A6M4ILR7_9BACT|nr:aspartate--tRNA ligase [Gemmatimonas groenlandica]QJR34995.1 aspartate--tRNA ligase [Gemmatimonas groenlandica]